MKPQMVNGFIGREDKEEIANPIKKEHPQTATNVALRKEETVTQVLSSSLINNPIALEENSFSRNKDSLSNDQLSTSGRLEMCFSCD